MRDQRCFEETSPSLPTNSMRSRNAHTLNILLRGEIRDNGHPLLDTAAMDFVGSCANVFQEPASPRGSILRVWAWQLGVPTEFVCYFLSDGMEQAIAISRDVLASEQIVRNDHPIRMKPGLMVSMLVCS